jgi:hypothetical protein
MQKTDSRVLPVKKNGLQFQPEGIISKKYALVIEVNIFFNLQWLEAKALIR